MAIWPNRSLHLRIPDSDRLGNAADVGGVETYVVACKKHCCRFGDNDLCRRGLLQTGRAVINKILMGKVSVIPLFPCLARTRPSCSVESVLVFLFGFSPVNPKGFRFRISGQLGAG